MTILVLNAGSATLKFRVFENTKERVAGSVERIGLHDSFITLNQHGASQQLTARKITDHTEALRLVSLALRETLAEDKQTIDVIGHRVVHGGEEFVHPTRVTRTVLGRLEKYNEWAPSHNPMELHVLAIARHMYPQIPHIAIFDTEFYQELPEHIYLYALPRALYAKYGIRRYGFHGLSHEYVIREAARLIGKPLKACSFISCHLGSGSSVTAFSNGNVIDTTMGFSPLEGLTMGTRVGDLDASVPLLLQRKAHLSEQKVMHVLYKESGLLGISGFSSDMRDILRAAHSTSASTHTQARKKRARLARDMYVYDVQRYVGSYFSLMPACDGAIFTGGIGERSVEIRRRILKGLPRMKHLKTLIIPTNEEQMVAEKIVAMPR
ncbi:MAG: acetate/propionate family kinase [Candidatus Kerfeldbacteria bacterium]|nr:acetate/propionate family kinase [Candidatus Kerfeldbacteria bacterium]